MTSASEKHPQHHIQKMKKRLEETVTYLRQDITEVNEPQLAAMFETSAEVLNGLIKTFDDYEKRTKQPGANPLELSQTCRLSARGRSG
jgi:hypothetical protein